MSAKKILRKSALALAIASISFSAYSKNIELSGEGVESTYKVTEDISDGLKVTGSSTIVAESSEGPSDNDLVGVMRVANGATVTGDIDVNASINISGDRGVGIDIYDGATVTGNVINRGVITINGEDAQESAGAGIAISSEEESTRVKGNVVNSGVIDVTGDYGWGIQVSGESSYNLDDLTESIIDGEIVNNGTIKFTQIDNPVVALEENEFGIGIEVASSVVGGILNNKDIIVDGTSVTGVYATGQAKVNEIENTGKITASGKSVRAIYVDNEEGVSEVGSITNSGVISASATESSIVDAKSGAIVVKGAQVELIDNETKGVIEASGAGVSAIYLEDTERFTRIVTDGIIKASNDALAIEVVNSDAGLEWDGGLIDGDVKGLNGAYIDNEVTFSGTLFDAQHIVIGTGKNSNRAIAHFTKPHTTIKTSEGLRVGNGANLAVQISDETDANKAILAVQGKAEFEKGTGVKVSSAQGLTIDGKNYILLSTTEGLTDNGLAVTGTSLLKVNSYDVKDGQILANVSVAAEEEIVEEVKLAGGSKNSQAVAKELNTLIVALPEGEFKNALMAAGTSPETLAAAVEELSPEVSGGAIQAAASGQSIISAATGSRTSSLRGMSSGEALKETGGWMQALYSDARQGQRDGIKGYNAYSRGLAIGADGKLSDDLTVGVAYSYLNSTVNGKSNNTTDVKGHAFTLYSGYELGNYFVDGNLTYSMNSNDSKRSVLGTTAKGSYDSTMLGASMTGGYTFKLYENMALEPLVSARYSNIKIDSYREKGSPAALSTGSQRYEIAELGLGARFSADYALGQGTLEPQVQVMALHDFAGDRSKSTSAFIAAGNPFVVSGAKPVRNSYEASVGADYLVGALTFGASYGYTGKSGFNSDTFSAKVRYDF